MGDTSCIIVSEAAQSDGAFNGGDSYQYFRACFGRNGALFERLMHNYTIPPDKICIEIIEKNIWSKRPLK